MPLLTFSPHGIPPSLAHLPMLRCAALRCADEEDLGMEDYSDGGWAATMQRPLLSDAEMEARYAAIYSKAGAAAAGAGAPSGSLDAVSGRGGGGGRILCAASAGGPRVLLRCGPQAPWRALSRLALKSMGPLCPAALRRA